MAQSGFAAFLLFLSLVVSNVYGDNTTILCEQILAANATLINASNSDFNLTVSPDILSNRTVYTVLLDGGAGNFTVLLQAGSSSGPEGTWSQENSSCNGSLFIDFPLNHTQLNTTWTSPDNVTSVTINVYIHNGNSTLLLQKTLNQEPITAVTSTIEAPTAGNSTTANSTATSAPTTGNSTSANSTATPGSVATTTHRVSQTTSAGSIEQSGLVSMALSVILGLLLIPNKCL